MGDLLDWLGNWLVWLVLAGGLAAAELLTLDFVLIMLGAGALAGAGAALLTGSAVISVIVATVVAVSMLGVVRPLALHHYRQGPKIRIGVDALVGKQAIVVEKVDAKGGRVRIDGEEWSARTYDEQSAIEVGRRVDVMSIDGATAYVYDIDKQLESE
ncbi:MAG TPA: NfeD family protein [Actinopolymorphaceae bacterium]